MKRTPAFTDKERERLKVLLQTTDGPSIPEIAKRFNVSVSWLYQYTQEQGMAQARKRRTGEPGQAGFEYNPRGQYWRTTDPQKAFQLLDLADKATQARILQEREKPQSED